MSSSSMALLKRTEVEPAYDWYVDLDQYLEPQSNVPGAHSRFQGIVAPTDSTVLSDLEIRAAALEVPQIEQMENSYVDR